MKEFTIRLGQRPVNLKVTEVSSGRHASGDLGRGKRGHPGANNPAEQQIKRLNDRIKILELELQKAREESFRVGYEEGQKSVMQESNRRIEAMRIEMQAMELKYLEAIEKVEGPLLEVAKRMAAEVLAMDVHLKEDADRVLYQRLRKMLYEVIDQNKVMVRVNPEHLKSIDSEQVAGQMKLPNKMQLNFMADNQLNKGELVVESEDYIIDGTFDNQLNHLKNNLTDEEE